LIAASHARARRIRDVKKSACKRLVEQMIGVSSVMVAAMVAVDSTAARTTEIDVAGVLETLGEKIGMIQGSTVTPTTNAKAVSATHQTTNAPNRKV
jgi:hypothetical protein